ncbi:MAG: TolB family protein, partial [Oceanicaulis sp.]
MSRFVTAAAIATLCALPAAAQETPERVTEGNLVMENIPEIPAAVRERLQQYANIRSASFSDFAPDGGIYITTRFGETTQIHHVAAPMAMRRQVTFYDERTGGASVRPGSDQFVFSKDIGGDEFYQGYVYDPETASATRFTEAGTRNGGFGWSDDGALLSWSRQGDGDPDADILVADLSGPSSVRVALEGEGALFPGDWSPNGRDLLVQRYYSITHSDLFVLNTETGEMTEILPELDVAYGGAEFAADGESVYLVTDWDSDFRRVLEIELGGGEPRAVTPDHGWDVETMDLSPDGSTLVYAINRGGVSELHMIDAATGAALAAPDLPVGLIGGVEFDAEGERLGFTH